MMYTMPKNLLSICVNFALATQPDVRGFWCFLKTAGVRSCEQQGDLL